MDRFDLNSEASRARLMQLHRHAQVGGCVSGIAHDINNLLGAAMAYAELAALDEGVSPDTSRMLEQIVDKLLGQKYRVEFCWDRDVQGTGLPGEEQPMVFPHF